MKRCIKAHSVASFGDIPVGSLWDDDSPYIEDEGNFVDDNEPPVKPKATAKTVKES